jgi:uncharacterized protein YndB with AHSA1/START domain
MDVRPGGAWRFIMHGPDGIDYPKQIVYREVKRPELLVYSQSGGEDGERQIQIEVTVQFVEESGKTRATMGMVFATAEDRNLVVEKYHALEGAKQTLDRLAELVETRSDETR